jgi:hypothetical protein
MTLEEASIKSAEVINVAMTVGDSATKIAYGKYTEAFSELKDSTAKIQALIKELETDFEGFYER